MRYWTFLLLVLMPAIALLSVVVWKIRERVRIGSALRAVVLVLVIAVAYTTPWDNYLIYRGVWWYGADRVAGTLGFVPVEEYVFMALQSIMTGLLTVIVFREEGKRPADGTARVVGLALWLLLAVGAAASLAFGQDRWVYLGLILAWAGPVLAGTWWLGCARYLGNRRRYVMAWGLPSMYLWFWDAVAIRSGVWSISERYTTGLAFGPLPFEEAVFFLLTNVLVVQGVLLFWEPVDA